MAKGKGEKGVCCAAQTFNHGFFQRYPATLQNCWVRVEFFSFSSTTNLLQFGNEIAAERMLHP